jgi:hypothetical protein
MAFVINSREWDFENWEPAQILETLEAVLERVAIARQRSEKVWIGEDFQTRAMYLGKDLWTFLSDKKLSNISQDVKNEFAAWMSSASYYADEELPPGMMDALLIKVDDSAEVENLDIAWAHHNVRNHTAVACLSLYHGGGRTTTSVLGSVQVHWVLNESSVVAFWRDAIDVERDCRETIERVGPHAFPNLYFQPGVWQGLDDLSDGYAPLRQRVRAYLSGLDDFGAWIFLTGGADLRRERDRLYESGTPSDKLVMDRFGALQMNVSPEKANVEAHVASRMAREVVVKGRTLYCEWHGKFEPHQNRVYFHKPVQESDNRVVIGIFSRHL